MFKINRLQITLLNLEKYILHTSLKTVHVHYIALVDFTSLSDEKKTIIILIWWKMNILAEVTMIDKKSSSIYSCYTQFIQCKKIEEIDKELQNLSKLFK